MPIFSLDGNVGVGKSTLLKQLENELAGHDVVIMLEPVDSWMNLRADADGLSLFELYYADKAKYGFAFQMMAMQTRFEGLVAMSKQNKNRIILCERSFLTDFHVFAQLGFKKGYISAIEMQVYKKWYEFILDLVSPDYGGTIYLRATPEVCLDRVKKRGRAGEEGIDLNYLTELHLAHEEWLMSGQEDDDKCGYILVMDANANGDVGIGKQIKEYIEKCV